MFRELKERVRYALDELFAGPESSDESRRVHERWRARVFHQRPDLPRPQPDTSND